MPLAFMCEKAVLKKITFVLFILLFFSNHSLEFEHMREGKTPKKYSRRGFEIESLEFLELEVVRSGWQWERIDESGLIRHQVAQGKRKEGDVLEGMRTNKNVFCFQSICTFISQTKHSHL